MTALDLNHLERVAREARPAMHAFSVPYQQAFNPTDMLALISRLRAAEAAAADSERRGWIAGRDAAAQQAECLSLGEEIMRLTMGAEVNHVKLYAAVSRTLAQKIRALTPSQEPSIDG